MNTNAKTEEMGGGRKRDALLDAWRGISVLLVIFYHMAIFRFAPVFADASGVVGWLRHQTARELDYLGPLGVQIFFVISGYIITKLLLREHERNGRVSLAAFYVRRAFRILPPLWLVLGTTFILAACGYIQVAPKSFLMAATFTCNFQPTSCGWFGGHTWSVATEEQFYLVWPLLLILLDFRHVARTALLLCIAFIVVDQGSVLTVAFIHNALSGACIAAGALYASSEKVRALIEKTSLPVMGIAALALFGKPFLQYQIRGSSAVVSALTPFLILVLIFSCSRYRSILEKWTAVRVLSAVGLVSYGLYLWQEMFLGSAASYLRPSFLEFAPLCALIVPVSYFLVEVPLMKMGARISRNLIDRGKTRPAVAIASQVPVLTTQMVADR